MLADIPANITIYSQHVRTKVFDKISVRWKKISI